MSFPDAKLIILFVIFLSFSGCFPEESREENSTKIENVNSTTKRVAEPHQFPFQVEIFVNELGEYADCGGSLIGRKTVLTAGRCVQNADIIYVVFGGNYLGISDSYQETFELTQKDVIIHEGLNFNTVHVILNDIALITLPKQVELDENVEMVQLATAEDEPFDSELGLVAGYLPIKENHFTMPKQLRYGEFPIIKNEECSSLYPGSIIPEKICAVPTKKHSACYGDFGSPLVVIRNEKFLQVGIKSYFGPFTCADSEPVVFTRISSYQNWIKEHIKN